MTLSRNLSTLGQAVTVSGNLPTANLTGTIASAQLSGSYTGITGVGTLSSITFADATVQNSSANTHALGTGQTWQNVTASRAFSTTYTNSTGRPIMIAVHGLRTTASTTTLFISLNGGTTFIFCSSANSGGGSQGNGSLIIPAGYTYAVTSGDGTIENWQELR